MTLVLALSLCCAAPVFAPSAFAPSAFAPTPARSTPAAAAELTFVLDPEWSMEPGTRTLISLGRVVLSYDAALPEPSPHALAILLRVARSVLVDGPLLGLEATVIHEVFGHGARAREAHLSPTYNFHLELPYSALAPQQKTNAETLGATSGQPDRDLAMVAAGIEANHYTAAVLAEQWAIAGTAHYGDAALYFGTKLSYLSSLMSLSATSQGGDSSTYLSLLAQRYNRIGLADRGALASRISWAYLANFADPLWWWSAVASATYLWRGDRWLTPLGITVGASRIMPRVGFALTPFGAEHTLEASVTLPFAILSASLRAASSGLAAAEGGSVRVVRWPIGERLVIGGELDLWHQPELLFDQRNVFDRPTLWGGALAADAHIRICQRWGLAGKIAVKSKGYLTAAPQEAGAYGYVGVWLAPSL